MKFLLNRENRPIVVMLSMCLMMISAVTITSIRTMKPSLGLTMDQMWLMLSSVGIITGYSSLILLICAVWSYDYEA